MTQGSQFPETADIETASDDYARRFSGPTGEWFLEVQRQGTLRMLASHPGTTILDVGGGHGQMAPALVQTGHDVTVLGSALSCGARIQALVDARRCSFVVGNIIDLPYPNRAFDVVISYRLLPHVAEWRRFLSELSRVARRAVLIDYPSTRSVNAMAPWLFQWKKHVEGNTRPFTCFREKELLREFRSFGYVLADRYPEFSLPMVIHRMLRTPRASAALEGFARVAGVTHLIGSPIILKLVPTTQAT